MHDLPHPLAAFARARPEHPALRVGDREWSARALLAAVRRAAARLAARGVGPGQRVALLGPPGAAWVVAFHAIGWRGASVLPQDPRDPPPARAARRRLADHALDLDDPAAGLAPQDLSDEASFLSGQAIDPEPLPPEPSWPLEQERALLFTSGTAGDPRPVALTTAQLLFAAVGGAIHLGHHLDDRWYACLPPWHVGGLALLLRTAWCQTTLDLAYPFDPAALSDALDRGRVTQLSLVPVMLRRLLEVRAGRPFPPQLRWILLGGAPPDEADVAAAEALGAVVCTTWGMTESAAQVVTRSPAGPRQPGVVGVPLPFVQVSQDTATGRLRLRGPQVGGDLLTADRGELRPGGAVVVHGRADRVVLSGGRNIDPAAVERVLLAHPAVADAHVLGAPDPHLGEALVALVVPRAAAPPDLARFVAERLHPHDRPRRWLLVRALPRGPAGKLPAAAARALLDRLAPSGPAAPRVALEPGLPDIIGPP